MCKLYLENRGKNWKKGCYWKKEKKMQDNLMKQVKLLKKVKRNSKKLILAKGNQNNLFHTDLNNRSSMQSDRESLKLSSGIRGTDEG